MEVKTKKIRLALPILLTLPLLLCGLFALVKGNRAVMDGWVFGVLAPVEQFLGRLWSPFPFSVAEVLTALLLLGSAGWLLRALALALRSREGRPLLHRLLALAAVWLWVLAGFNWLWNAAYYASTFSQRSALETAPYSVEELAAVTEYFAQNAARLSSQIPRDENGHFAADLNTCFQQGLEVYDSLTSIFPCLSMRSVKAKPIFCSRLQSILGFTGVYFPFTGEANVNTDAPRCLLPATIAHEMAHQRMVASELEANFVGIAACTSCSDTTYQYSGWLMGLTQLCNALYPTDPQEWQAIAGRWFTPELTADWLDNNAYWAALSSPVEDAAEDAYDAFLKSNDQDLGIRSYGACVDLLTSYYRAEAVSQSNPTPAGQ